MADAVEGHWRELGDGQLPNVKTALYTAQPKTEARIYSIVLVNTTGGAITVNIYKNASGTSRQIIGGNTSIGANASLVIEQNITLEPNGSIEGDASAATSIDYTINGAEKRTD